MISWSSTSITLIRDVFCNSDASTICVKWDSASYGCTLSELARYRFQSAFHTLGVRHHVSEAVSTVCVVIG